MKLSLLEDTEFTINNELQIEFLIDFYKATTLTGVPYTDFQTWGITFVSNSSLFLLSDLLE